MPDTRILKMHKKRVTQRVTRGLTGYLPVGQLRGKCAAAYEMEMRARSKRRGESDFVFLQKYQYI